MIPHIIHYCWFGRRVIPKNLRAYIETWHRHMPDWTYMEWNESNFDITTAPLYVRQAYEAQKYAFVSDYVRLWALEQFGGVYLDTDVEVLKPFEPLLANASFIGFEESKAKTLGTNVIGAEPHSNWICDMLLYYEKTPFLKVDGQFDTTPNSELIARFLQTKGLIRDGYEQIVHSVHVYDFHYFSPITSTRVMRKNKNTFSIHHYAGSWTGNGTAHWYDHLVCREIVNALIQIKRHIRK